MYMKSKRELREEILNKREGLSSDDVESFSKVICGKIAETAYYADAADICVYMPIRNEVRLAGLVNAARKDGKTLWLPRTEDGVMRFYRWDDGTEMTRGPFGIWEPEPCYPLPEDRDVLVIMPGAVFSRDRDRIGYGGGYYDRFLKNRENSHTIAVCYDIQIVGEIPAERHDVRPDMVMSEKRTIGCGAG